MLYHPPATSVRLADVLHALADPVRLAFVRVLVEDRGGVNCADTMARAGVQMPKSTCSHHFKILRRAGVVFSQRRGVELINFLRSEDLEGRFPGMLAVILAASADERSLAAA